MDSNRKMHVFTKFCAHYRGNTALKATVPAVLPQTLSALLRFTAVLPQQRFPLPQ